MLTGDTSSDTILNKKMSSVDEIIKELARNPKDVRFTYLCRICNYYFGEPRHKSSSHHVYKTPWQGDPRVNIQNDKGKAKEYQVRQVIKALRRIGV